jgi:sulfate transport system permease protein
MPLRVQKLWEGSNNSGAFALASVLTMLALVTLVLKVLIEPKVRDEKTGGTSNIAEKEPE